MANILSSGCPPISGHGGSIMSESGVGTNVGVAIEMSFVVVLQAETTCIYADFTAFPVFIEHNKFVSLALALKVQALASASALRVQALAFNTWP